MHNQSQGQCELELGVILRRRCREPAAVRCASCQRRVCRTHQRAHGTAPHPVTPWCLDCLRRVYGRERLEPAPNRPHLEEHSHQDPSPIVAFSTPGSGLGPPPSTTERWSGDGGEFGGGGASATWAPATEFSPEDYAAFDRTVEADRRGLRGSYDS